jgi:FdhD protein
MKLVPHFCEPPEEHTFATHRTQTVSRWLKRAPLVHALDQIAEEVPIAMVYNGISHVVMLATPSDLEQFALGFSLAEGILQDRRELRDIEVVQQRDGIEVQMEIAQERFVALKARRRNLAGRTGCGLCGTESLQQVMRPTHRVETDLRLSPESVHAALRSLPERQALQSLTGAVHAAAWVLPNGVIAHIEEDIGRHNALDKLIGRLAEHDADFAHGYAIVTSRAILVAVSAPTGLAIDLAQESGLTLAGFARNGSHVIYTHPQRFTE